MSGQHVTENGQTIHMVAQALAPRPPGSQAVQGVAAVPQGSSASRSTRLMVGGLQGGQPMPPELTQAIGALLGVVGRSAGIGATVLHAGNIGVPGRPTTAGTAPVAGELGRSSSSTSPRRRAHGALVAGASGPQPSRGAPPAAPPVPTPSAVPSNTVAPAAGADANTVTEGPAAVLPVQAPGPAAAGSLLANANLRFNWLPWHSLLLALPVVGLIIGGLALSESLQGQSEVVVKGDVAPQTSISAGALPWYGLVMAYHVLSLLSGLTLYFALRSTPPLTRISALFAESHAAQQGQQHQQLLLGQAIAALALPALPTTLQTQQILFQPAVGMPLRVPMPGEAATPGTDQESHSQYGEELPWRELQCLNRHLAHLLRRAQHSVRLPPAHMPQGEVHAFLSALHGSTSQLGVGISDMQAAYADAAGPQQQQVVQFASALEAASHALRGLAASMRVGLAEEGTASASEGDAGHPRRRA